MTIQFQRHSKIASAFNLQPDSVLQHASGFRAIIEICCSNFDFEAKNLAREQTVEEVDMVIAVTPNKKAKKSLERAVAKNPPDCNAQPVPLIILDAGECLKANFDWSSVFQKYDHYDQLHSYKQNNGRNP